MKLVEHPGRFIIGASGAPLALYRGVHRSKPRNPSIKTRTTILERPVFGKKKKIEEQPSRQMSGREYDRFMGRVYKMVGCHRNSDAVFMLMDEFDYLKTGTHEFEALYKHVEQWGPSRTLLCLGRLIIYKLDREKHYGRVLAYIEKCQNTNPRFVLPELSRVTFYARQAIEAGKLDVAKNLVVDNQARYGDLVGSGECDRLLKLIEPDIDVTVFAPGE